MGVRVLPNELDRTDEEALTAALEAAIDAKDRAEVDRLLEALRPPFLLAIFEDARSFALHRDEPVDFGSRWSKWRTAFRLMWQSDDYFGVFLYRVRCALRARGVPVLPRLLEFVTMVLCQIRIGDHVVVKEGIYFPHGQVTLSAITVIGRRCVFGPWSGAGTLPGSSRGPRIANDVFVGTGSKVMGAVHIGKNAVVSVNSFVSKDVPPFAVAVGVPARIVRGGASPGSATDDALEPGSDGIE
jgi:serine O-acetyltransferase